MWRGDTIRPLLFSKSAGHCLSALFSSKKNRMAFVDSSAPWIAQHACQLKVGESLSYTYEDHKITLTCEGTHPSLNGNVRSMPEQPTDLTTLQKDGFDIAIQHALKKLRKYKLKRKRFTTVLLLEDIAGVKYEQVRKQLTFFGEDFDILLHKLYRCISV